MDCEVIVVPVHQDMHWVLAAISLATKEVQYLDSLGGIDQACLARTARDAAARPATDAPPPSQRNLARYVCDEAKQKKQETWDPSEWTLSAPRDIPAQHNGCDCGVFMLKYADWLARGAELSFTQEHMPYFRRRIVAELLKQATLVG
jgi:sentrin-specific protease 1